MNGPFRVVAERAVIFCLVRKPGFLVCGLFRKNFPAREGSLKLALVIGPAAGTRLDDLSGYIALRDYPISDRAICGNEFACDSMATAD